MRKVIVLFMLLFLAVVSGIFAGGKQEADVNYQEFTVPIPESPSAPNLPRVLTSEEDFLTVVEAFDDLIILMEPIIESMVFNGLEANRQVLDDLRDVTQWWRGYISNLKIQAENPKLRDEEVDEFLSSLMAKDVQFQNKLDRLNQVIDLENQETNG